MSKKIYFDLDGTLYDLYSLHDWLGKIQREESGLFNVNNMFMGGDYGEFNEVCLKLLERGYTFGVITWLPAQASSEYEEVCRQEKLKWIEKYLPFVTEKNVVSYGTPKQNCIQKRASTIYLIDDNLEVCKMWETQKQRIAKQVDLNTGMTATQILKDIYLQEITIE